MAYRYKLIDTAYGSIAGRFTSLDRATREVKAAVGEPGRFVLIDRETGEKIAESGRESWLAG